MHQRIDFHELVLPVCVRRVARTEVHGVDAVRGEVGGVRPGLLRLDRQVAGSAEGPHEGLILQKSFWLNGGALPISKRALDALGFEGMTPSKILAHTTFKELPAARVYLGYRDFEGRPVVELSAFAPAESGPDASAEAGGAK